MASHNLPLPELVSGLEYLVFIDDKYASAIRFHDAPRNDTPSFIQHLDPKHGVAKVMLVSGDRESEVKYLAESVGITEVYAGRSPEEKVAIVKLETSKTNTLFVGDGINDAPALMAATVGVAFGTQNDITTEAADAVVFEPALGKIDELMNIGQRMRRIALQSALGGMAASVIGMVATPQDLLRIGKRRASPPPLGLFKTATERNDFWDFVQSSNFSQRSSFGDPVRTR